MALSGTLMLNFNQNKVSLERSEFKVEMEAQWRHEEGKVEFRCEKEWIWTEVNDVFVSGRFFVRAI